MNLTGSKNHFDFKGSTITDMLLVYMSIHHSRSDVITTVKRICGEAPY